MNSGAIACPFYSEKVALETSSYHGASCSARVSLKQLLAFLSQQRYFHPRWRPEVSQNLAHHPTPEIDEQDPPLLNFTD